MIFKLWIAAEKLAMSAIPDEIEYEKPPRNKDLLFIKNGLPKED